MDFPLTKQFACTCMFSSQHGFSQQVISISHILLSIKVFLIWLSNLSFPWFIPVFISIKVFFPRQTVAHTFITPVLIQQFLPVRQRIKWSCFLGQLCSKTDNCITHCGYYREFEVIQWNTQLQVERLFLSVHPLISPPHLSPLNIIWG